MFQADLKFTMLPRMASSLWLFPSLRDITMPGVTFFVFLYNTGD